MFEVGKKGKGQPAYAEVALEKSAEEAGPSSTPMKSEKEAGECRSSEKEERQVKGADRLTWLQLFGEELYSRPG